MLFRRQQVVGERIVDFLAPSIRLIVEVDGPYHRRGQLGDKLRQRELERAGYRVLRLEDELVLSQPELARKRVVEAVAQCRGHR